MLKARYFFRLIYAFLKKFKGLIIIGAFFGVGLFFLVTLISNKYLQKHSEVIGISGRYHPENLPNQILSLIGDSLTKINSNGMVEPNLAKNWETSDKGKTWLFTLNDAIVWQNGKVLTSSDISYNFSDLSAENIDEKSIKFTLKEPYSPFPSVLSSPVFLQGLIGTGKWRVTDLKIANTYVSKLTLEKDEIDEKNKKTKLIKIYKFYPTEERAKLAFKLGEVNSLQSILDATPFTNWATTSVESSVNYNQIVTVFFNNKDALLSEKNIRQALYYALNKEIFDGERAISPISKNSWAFNPQVKRYAYNQDRARELIDTLPDEAKTNLKITLISASPLLSTAEKIADSWKDIGIETNVQVSSVIPTEFQAYLAVLQPPVDPDQYSLWHTTQTQTNISKYSDARIDKLLEDGRTQLYPEERRKTYLDFQRFLLEDVPALFLYYPNQYTISRK
jgi:peptide/nickel transport system substrate-binding protein